MNNFYLPGFLDQADSLLEVDGLRHEEHPLDFVHVPVGSCRVGLHRRLGGFNVLGEAGRHGPGYQVAVELCGGQLPGVYPYGGNVVPANRKALKHNIYCCFYCYLLLRLS